MDGFAPRACSLELVVAGAELGVAQKWMVVVPTEHRHNRHNSHQYRCSCLFIFHCTIAHRCVTSSLGLPHKFTLHACHHRSVILTFLTSNHLHLCARVVFGSGRARIHSARSQTRVCQSRDRTHILPPTPHTVVTHHPSSHQWHQTFASVILIPSRDRTPS